MRDESRRPADPPLAHMRQLDGLRAVAVGMVLWAHYLADFGAGLPLARGGVLLFFVLSGFLITSVLLRCRDYVRADGQSPWLTLRQFYVRRFLRIFPLFYAALLLGAAANVSPIRQTILWHLGYLSNVYLARRGEWHAAVSHFWSLAVEEQFYLVWPWCVLFVAPRRLPWLVAGAIAAAPAVRAIGIANGMSAVSVRVLTPACMDALGTGALLAVLGVPAARSRVVDALLSPLAGVLALGLAVVATACTTGAVRGIWLDVALAVLAAWVVGWAARGGGGVAGRVLGSAPAVAIGRISYGIYVFHPLTPVLLEKVRMRVEVGGEHAVPVAVGLTAVTVTLAALSWRCFEGPLNGLKRHFPYRLATATPPVAARRAG